MTIRYGFHSIVLYHHVLNSSNKICSIDLCPSCLSFLIIYVLIKLCNFDLSFSGTVNCILSFSSVSSSISRSGFHVLSIFFSFLNEASHLSKKYISFHSLNINLIRSFIPWHFSFLIMLYRCGMKSFLIFLISSNVNFLYICLVKVLNIVLLLFCLFFWYSLVYLSRIHLFCFDYLVLVLIQNHLY